MLNQIFGILLFLTCAFLLSSDKKSVIQHWYYIVFALIFEIAMIFAITHLSIIANSMENIALIIMKLKDHILEGTKFVFGYLGGGNAPFIVSKPENMFIFALQALPMIILVSALCAILTYMRIIPLFSKIIGTIFGKIYGIKHQLGMFSAVKIFLGQFEAPMVIKNSLQYLSTNEMFLIISAAFSTASASLMPIYASTVSNICPNAMTHVITSSLIGILSTIIVCLIIAPCFSESNNIQKNNIIYSNFIGALNKGIADGAAVWWAIVGSLIGMVALVSLTNSLLSLLPNVAGAPISLQRICGIIVYPLAWIFGIPECDIVQFSQVLGVKFVTNEMVAYFDLAKTTMQPESIKTAIYAITNFGNFACIGMTAGGLSAMCQTRNDIAAVSGKAFIAGTLATFISTTLSSLF